MKNCLFILVFLICITTANSQNHRLDSLKRSLAVAKEDTTRVLLLAELSLWSIFSNPDTSLQLAREGIRLAQQINYSKGEAYCKRSVGFFFWSIGDYTTAIKLAFLSMPYAEASNDIELQRWLNDVLLNAYRDNGDYDEAIKYDLKNRMISQKLHQPIEAKREAMLANIYYEMNQLDLAQHYIRLSLNKDGIADGWTCLTTGKIQAKLHQPDSAFYYYKLSIAKLIKAKNFKGLANAYQSIAALYFSDGHIDSAIYHAQNGLALAQQKSFLKEQLDLTSFLAEAYGKKNTDSAFRYYKLAMKARDSLFNREKAKQVLSFQFNEELRQQGKIQQLTLRQRNIWIYILLSSLAAIGLIGLLFYSASKRKHIVAKQAAEIKDIRIKELEQEKQLVAVNSILQAQEAERSRMAKDLHDGLGGLLSGIKLTLHSISDAIPQKIAPAFSKVINQLDTVIKEMRRVAHNMMPEALLKFGLGEAIQDYCDGINESNIIKIKYTQIGSLQTLTQSTVIVLYRIIQELTNNSIKHAAAKNIFVQLTKHQQGYTITVEDDGKGFDAQAVPDTKGTGLQNVRSRVEYLKGSFTADSEGGKGTSINIEIPN